MLGKPLRLRQLIPYGFGLMKTLVTYALKPLVATFLIVMHMPLWHDNYKGYGPLIFLFCFLFSVVLMLYYLYVESSLVGFLRGGWLHTQVQPSPAQEEVSM